MGIPKKTGQILLAAWVVFTMIAIYLVYFKVIPYFHATQAISDRNRGCEIYHETYVRNIRFKVLKKFTDEANHGNWTVYYSYNGNKRGTAIFDDGLNLFFYNLQPGDSVIKKENSMYYDLKSKITLKDSMYEYYVKCEDTIKAQRPQPGDKNLIQSYEK